MARALRVVTVRTELVAVDRGLWCTRCNLSSGVRAFVVVEFQGRWSLLTRLQCAECGSHQVEAAR